MTVKEAKRIFFLGIAGTGMRGLAYLLASQGKQILGTDTQLPSPLPEDLSAYMLAPEHAAEELLEKADLIIHTDAAPKSHPLLQHARPKHIPAISYQEGLGQLSADLTTIAVTGTHGKSSTTAMLGHILIKTGHDPSVLVGAPVPGWPGAHARSGKGKFLVVEADEYRNHFLSLTPAHEIITSIDFDHPDFFVSLDDVVQAYDHFVQLLPAKGIVVVPQDVREGFSQIHWPAGTISISPKEIEATAAPLPGRHMQSNAALAIQMAMQVTGITRDQTQTVLQSFPGLGRRLEIIGTFQNLQIISDYGHHPAEISVTLQTAKNAHAGQRILVIFEAHTQKRLDVFLSQFAQALAPADGVVLYPPFLPKGREARHATAQLEELKQKLETQHTPTLILNNVAELKTVLSEKSSSYDIALAFTAGTLDQHLRTLV